MTESAAYRKIDRLLYVLQASADPLVHKIVNLLEKPHVIKRVEAVIGEVRRVDLARRTDFTTVLLASLEYDDDRIPRRLMGGSNGSEASD